MLWLNRGLMLRDVRVEIVATLAVEADDDDSPAHARLTLWHQRSIRAQNCIVSQCGRTCNHVVFQNRQFSARITSSRKLCASANFQAWIINNPLNCRWRADSTLVYFLMTKTIWFKCDPWRVCPYLSFLQGEVIEVTNLWTGWPAQSGSSSIVSFPSIPSGLSWKGPSAVSQAYWNTQEWFSLNVCAAAKLWKNAAVLCSDETLTPLQLQEVQGPQRGLSAGPPISV